MGAGWIKPNHQRIGLDQRGINPSTHSNMLVLLDGPTVVVVFSTVAAAVAGVGASRASDPSDGAFVEVSVGPLSSGDDHRG